jgi:SAM-dependent methyltransferase
LKGLVNWEMIRDLAMPAPLQDKNSDAISMWDRSAYMYDKMAKLEREYTENQINTLILDSNDSVLDVGCGPGRIAVPVAKRAARVTALDASAKMLEYCMKNAKQQGLSNITPKQIDWNTAKVGVDVEKHDVVIASRSVGLRDIIKLNSAANKYVFILSFAQRPSLKEVQMDLFKGITQENIKFHSNRMFGYNIVFNILYDLGIDPNVRIVKDGFTKDYATYEEAYDDLRTLGEVKPEQESLFRDNVNKYLTKNHDGSVTFRRETKTYIMWWEPQDLSV